MSISYRQLGQSGLTVSTVGLGCNAFGTRIDGDRTRSVVEAALESGVTFFDTADIYGTGASEELLGRSLGSRRGEVGGKPIADRRLHSCVGHVNSLGRGRAHQASPQVLRVDLVLATQVTSPGEDPPAPLPDLLLGKGHLLYVDELCWQGQHDRRESLELAHRGPVGTRILRDPHRHVVEGRVEGPSERARRGRQFVDRGFGGAVAVAGSHGKALFDDDERAGVVTFGRF